MVNSYSMTLTNEAEQERLDRLSQAIADVARNASDDENEAAGVIAGAQLLVLLDQGFSELEAARVILESAEEGYARARARAGGERKDLQ